MKVAHLRNLLIILVVSIAITFTFDLMSGGHRFTVIAFSLNVIYGFIIGGSISLTGLLSSFIVNRFDIQTKPIKVYVILLISVFVFITIDVFTINILWYRYVHDIPFNIMFSKSGLVITSLITIFIGLTIFFIILSSVYMNKFIMAEKEMQKAVHEADSAKFEILKSQINPHFLFNSLNTLSTLIHIDAKRADRFTTQLSNIYRYVLETQDEDLVTVSEEFEFARKYAYLQSIRFNDSFSIEFQDYKGDDKPMMVPLSLQLLLENVFKHNVVSQRQKVHISVFFEDNYLVVSNNKNKGKEIKVSHSVGLSNILNRYEVLSDDECIIEDTQNYFTVKLPLIFTD